MFNESKQYFNILSSSDIDTILEIFKSNSNYYLIKDNNPNWIRLPLMKNENYPYRKDIRFFVNKVSQQVLNYTLLDNEHFGDNIYKTLGPYGPHVDSDTYLNKKSFVQMVIPLHVEQGNTKFFTFNEHWLGGRTSFRHGKLQNNTLVNDIITEPYTSYSEFIKFNKDSVSQDWYNKNIDLDEYLPYTIYNDLSIEKEFNYDPGSVIVFDNTRIHCSHNLKLTNALYKIGLSIILFQNN